MSHPLIEANNLSKLYHIGALQPKTLRETTERLWQKIFPKARPLPSVPETDPETLWALKDISFSVQEGEIVGIIGRNGAGKSTLLKILSRITEPTSGRAVLRGRIASLLEVGTGFHPELTGRENIYLNGTILGMRKREIDRKFDEIVAFAEIEKFIDTPVKHYSSGMYVRLGFAVAAHLEPEILFVDEVLSVGDYLFQQKCLGKIGVLSRAGRTVLLVSHNLAAIKELASSCIVLEEGRITYKGITVKALEYYLEQLCPEENFNRVSSGNLTPPEDLKWQFLNVKINTKNGRIASQDSLEIEMTYRAHQDLESILVGISISGLLGGRLINCYCKDSGLVLSSKAGETGSVIVRIEKPHLSSGVYFLSIGAGFDANRTLHYIENALRFEVVPDIKDDWAMIRSNLGLRLPSTWRVEKGCPA